MHGYKWPINCTRTRAGATAGVVPAAAEHDGDARVLERDGQHDVVRAVLADDGQVSLENMHD